MQHDRENVPNFFARSAELVYYERLFPMPTVEQRRQIEELERHNWPEDDQQRTLKFRDSPTHTAAATTSYNGYWFYAAFSGETIIGYALFDLRDAQRVYMDDVGLEHYARGHNIARHLLAYAVHDLFQKTQASVIWTKVHPGNAKAYKLYLNIGFKKSLHGVVDGGRGEVQVLELHR